MTLFLSILVGIVAGICSGLFGIGGGVIIVPMLVFLFQYSQQTATATSLMALLLPVGALGLWQYYRSGFIHMDQIKVGLMIAVGLFIGAFIGAKMATNISGETLTKMFSLFLIIIAIRLWF